VVQRLGNAFVRARKLLHEHADLSRRLSDLGIAGVAQEILLATHLRGEPVALSDLIVAGAVGRDVAGSSIGSLLNHGHLQIDEGSIGLAPATATAIACACAEAGIDCT
jgi:hypothetical protein